MTVTGSALHDALLEHHELLTRAFSDLIASLRGDDPEDARTIAEELDHAVGPFVEFEESVLYPALTRTLGLTSLPAPQRDDDPGLRAVRALLMRDATQSFTEVERDALLADAQDALDRALTCRTLASHVPALDDAVQADLLEALRRGRQRGHRWSELPRRRG